MQLILWYHRCLATGVLVTVFQQLVVAGEATSFQLFPIIQPSLFSNVPPYIKFKRPNSLNATSTSKLPVQVSLESKKKYEELLSQLKFGSSLFQINELFKQTGLDIVSPLENPYVWFGMINACSRKRWPDYSVETIVRQPFQKYNIAPGSEQLAFKKLHHFHTQRAIEKHGEEEFDFMLETYALPEEYDKFKAAAKKGGGGVSWILKPSNGWLGKQVKLYEDWRYVPRRTKNSIVQKNFPNSEQYAWNSNGSKVELRINIVVSRFNPLRVYRYGNGFAKIFHENRAEPIVKGESPEKGVFLRGRDTHISLLSAYERLRLDNCNMSLLDGRIDDIVVKTLLTTEQVISEQVHAAMFSHYNAFQVFSFDLILDTTCKPFLLEVNRYGSLSPYSNMTHVIRDAMAPFLVDMMNLVGHHFPPYISKTSAADIRDNMIQGGHKSPVDEAITFDERLYTFEESEKEKHKHKRFKGITERADYLDTILSDLLPGDLRYLIQAEDELFRGRDFRKIFPTNTTFTYMEYVESDSYYYKLQDAWEMKYGGNRLEGINKLNAHAILKQHLQTDNKGLQKNRNKADAIID